jgi:hypothetical protein
MPILVQAFASRSTVSEEVEGLRICIPAKWSWALIFPAAWLCAWTVGGVAAGLSLLRHFSFFICVWMIGWAVGELMVGYIVLYAIGGREVILVNSESLTSTTQIFGVGRSKSYRVGEMSNLRFQPEVIAGRTRLPSRIAFDYGGKVYGFGAGIDEAEAAQIISRIRQRCGIVEASAPQTSGIKFWQPR